MKPAPIVLFPTQAHRALMRWAGWCHLVRSFLIILDGKMLVPLTPAAGGQHHRPPADGRMLQPLLPFLTFAIGGATLREVLRGVKVEAAELPWALACIIRKVLINEARAGGRVSGLTILTHKPSAISGVAGVVGGALADGHLAMATAFRPM